VLFAFLCRVNGSTPQCREASAAHLLITFINRESARAGIDPSNRWNECKNQSMSDVELIVVLGLLALLAVGIVLMLAPVESTQEPLGLVLREIEPRVGEENQLVDFRYSVRRIETSDNESTSKREPGSRDEDFLPELVQEDEPIADEPPEWPGDELFYLAATEEVDGEQRQPGLWAKALALNAGDERRARFHYIRMRVAQIIDNQPKSGPDEHARASEKADEADISNEPEEGGSEEAGAKIETGSGEEMVAGVTASTEALAEVEDAPRVKEVAGVEQAPKAEEIVESGGIRRLEERLGAEAVPRLDVVYEVKGVRRAKESSEAGAVRKVDDVVDLGKVRKAQKVAGASVAAKAHGTAGAGEFAPILNHELVKGVIEGGRVIGDLIRSANLIRDYSVRQYVTGEDVRKTSSVTGDQKPEASSYFKDYHHRTSVSLGDSLQRFDPGVVRSYLISRQFPHQIELDFFDEALVITIQPRSPQMEFLVLIPGAGLDDPFGARFLASSRITELFMAAASENENPLTLYIELDLLLERLRIG